MNDLAAMHCKPLEGQAAMSAAEIEAQLQQLEGWSHKDGAIEKSFRFADYHHTMAFVNAVAWIAHTQDHHPDLTVGYDKCKVRYSTHSVGGLSENDFICAARVERLMTA